VASSSTEICAAYIAGGILSGGITAESSTRMLTCLSPGTRELVLRSLAIEAASLGSRGGVLPSTTKADLNSVNNNDYTIQGDSPAGNVNANAFSIQLRNPGLSRINPRDTTKNMSTIYEPVPDISVDSSLKTNDFTESKALSPNIVIKKEDAYVDDNSIAEISSQFIKSFYRVSKDFEDVRSNLEDIDDPSAATLRLALMRSGESRKDVLAVAMALRAARLQHASSATLGMNYWNSGSMDSEMTRLSLPQHLKHRLALDTLQLWAPISFQA